MTAIHTYPLSTALADARAALTAPKGAPAAELAGHLLVLGVYGNEDEQAFAEDFASDMRYRPDLAIWLDVIMAQPKAAALPVLAPPERPRSGWRLDDMAVICGVAFAAVMTVTALLAPWIWR